MGLDDLATMIEAGAAMLGASAGDDLVPEVFRVWGASCEPSARRLRALVSADAGRTLEHVTTGRRLCFTFTDINDFRSIQVKGPCMGPAQPPGPADVAVMRRYGKLFEEQLVGVGHRLGLAERLRPASVFVVELDIDAVFDQTPGSEAGLAVAVGP